MVWNAAQQVVENVKKCLGYSWIKSKVSLTPNRGKVLTRLNKRTLPSYIRSVIVI
jgi:hypothetical protein